MARPVGPAVAIEAVEEIGRPAGYRVPEMEQPSSKTTGRRVAAAALETSVGAVEEPGHPVAAA